MGNIEKLVVLIVLFLAAVLLAVSLRDGEAEAESPLEAARSLLEEEAGPPASPIDAGKDVSDDVAGAELPVVAASEKPEKPSPDFLLDADARATGAKRDGGAKKQAVEVPAPAASEPPVEKAPGISAALDDGPVRILRTTRGLEPSALEDFMVYTVESGDTWSSLAQRFYRDRGRAEVLGRANEGVRELVAGTSILVPVYDLAREAERRDPWRSVTPPGPAEAAGKGEPAKAIEAGSHLGATSYVVASGDTLSGISLKVYGTARHWKEIFEANRPRMASPDWLQVGMRLDIPRGAELESLSEDLREAAKGRPRVR